MTASESRRPHRRRATTGPMPPTSSPRALRERILVLDGAMGTAIQRDRPDEAGYRGERFADWPSDLQGNNDLLTLTQPDIIAEHPPRVPRGRRRPDRDQHLQRQRDLAGRLRPGGARLRAQPRGRRGWPAAICDEVTARTPDRPRYVAGALGPTTRTASISPDVNDPGARNVAFDQLVAAYLEAARGLVDGGADLLFIETIFDTLNAKAAIFAVETLFEEHGRRWPVIISGTITDASGPHPVGPGRPRRSGTPCATRARWPSASTAPSAPRRCAPTSPRCPGSPTPSCSLLPQRRAAQRLRRVRRGRPRRPPRSCGSSPRPGFVNLVGGCCGTTPAHIARHRRRRRRPSRRARVPTVAPALRLSGLEPFTDRRRQPLRQRRRAHQHHRLGEVPQPDQGRRLRHRARRRASSRSRTARRSSTSTWTRA